jgi:probable rRNA maturation factor
LKISSRAKTELGKITIKNIHPKLKVKKKALKLLVENILKSEKADSGVDVLLVDDKFMRQLNRKFNKKDRTTDVLSFGMHEPYSYCKKGGLKAFEYPSLGDIYVCLDQAKRQAKEYGVAFEEEVRLLVAHGVLHLLGYDHSNKKEEVVMREKEKMYLRKKEILKA